MNANTKYARAGVSVFNMGVWKGFDQAWEAVSYTHLDVYKRQILDPGHKT